MPTRTPKFPLKSVLAGAFAGALVFLALTAVKAQQTLTVNDLRSNPKPYMGGTVAITGLVANVRTEMRAPKGQSVKVPWTKLNLYDTDAKGRKGSRYVYVSLPSSSFTPAPNEGDRMTVTGPLNWPYEIGVIEQ